MGAGSGIGLLMGVAIMASVPLYFVLQIVLLARYREGWRIAAAVPLLVTGPALASAVYGFAIGSNLAPIWLVLASPLACIYLAVVAAQHRSTERRANEQHTQPSPPIS